MLTFGCFVILSQYPIEFISIIFSTKLSNWWCITTRGNTTIRTWFTYNIYSNPNSQPMELSRFSPFSNPILPIAIWTIRRCKTTIFDKFPNNIFSVNPSFLNQPKPTSFQVRFSLEFLYSSYTFHQIFVRIGRFL